MLCLELKPSSHSPPPLGREKLSPHHDSITLVSAAGLCCSLFCSPYMCQPPGRSHSHRRPADAHGLGCALDKCLIKLLMPHEGTGTDERTEGRTQGRLLTGTLRSHTAPPYLAPSLSSEKGLDQVTCKLPPTYTENKGESAWMDRVASPYTDSKPGS